MDNLNKRYLLSFLAFLFITSLFSRIIIVNYMACNKVIDNTLAQEFPSRIQTLNHGKKARITHSNPSFGEELFTGANHESAIRTIAISPDQRLLASGGDDLIIRIWSIAEGRVILAWPAHSLPVGALIFSLDGSLLISGGPDMSIKLWNVINGNLTKTLPGITSGVSALAFSSDGKRLFSASSFGMIKIWNTTDWTEEREPIRAHEDWIHSIHISSDGALLISSSHDQTVKIWNTTNWNIIRTLTGFSDLIYEAKFSLVTRNLITFAGNDNIFWVWDLQSDRVIHKFEGHTPGIRNLPAKPCVDFSPDGKIIATGGNEGFIKLWDMNTGELITTLPGHRDSLTKVIFSPDGTFLTSSSLDSTIKVWNVASGAELQTLTEQTSVINSVVFSHSGTRLASASEDQTVVIWNVTKEADGEKFQKLQTLSAHTGGVNSVSFSPDDAYLATCGDDNVVILWNTTNWNPIHTFTGHSEEVLSTAFSPTGLLLASGGESPDIPVRIWNVTNGLEVNSLFGHSSDINSINFSPNSLILASASSDSDIKFWNTTDWVELNYSPITDHNKKVNDIQFSPNGQILASGSDDTTIRLWNTTNGKQLSHSPLLGYSEPILTVTFYNDTILASGSNDGTIQLWNVLTGENIKTYSSHAVAILSLDFTPDGSKIISGATNGDIIVWDILANPDLDMDGMYDGWELKNSLNPYNFWDKFDDEDADYLMNSLESFLGTNPLSNDSDNDGLPDGWEYLGGLDPTDNLDFESDYDGDMLPAWWEFLMGLKSRFNDAKEDPDGDGLTNLLEYYIGTKANERDSDLDGIPDGWEYDNQLNATDPSDATRDYDGDWIINIDEYKGGSNPHNFFSVPLFSFSLPNLVLVSFLLGLTGLTVTFHQKRSKKVLITQLNAPDYQTALKIRSSGLSNYFAFVQAYKDAKQLFNEGTSNYYQGMPIEAIQLYEQALTVFERLGDDLSFAKTIFWLTRVQKERQELTADSSILKLFPQPPYVTPAIDAINHMLKALLAEADKNWGMATKSWQAALSDEKLELDLSIICQGALLESEVRDWLNDPIDTTRETVVSHLEEFQEICKQTQHFSNLCQAYLLRSRVSFASFQFEQAEKWLKECLAVAKVNKLPLYDITARKERKILSHHKSRIQEEMDKAISPEEQAQILQEYIKEALTSLRKEGLV
ncbi:MAG: WD40 repeat domain-containing protein [Candidatus Hodarchaeales archaeon]|jgi:WD40 repeat protein